MNDLPEDREELLQGLVCGDLDPTDPAVAARLAEDPELAARWREFQELENALGAAGTLRDEALAAAQDTSVQGPDDAEMLQRIRAAAQRHETERHETEPEATAPRQVPSPAAETPRPSRILWAAAALVAVSLGTVWYTGAFDPSPAEAPGYRWLGSGGVLVPDGLPFGTLRFELTDDDPLDTEVNVLVHALDRAGTRGAEVGRFLDCGTDPLELTVDQLGDHTVLEWEIEVRTSTSAVPTVHRYQQSR